VRILLDTHIALWAVADDARLPAKARRLMLDAENTVFVSAVSVWEIAIKHMLPRGTRNDIPISGTEALEHFAAAGYEMLAITAVHAAAIDGIPMPHADPFDRLLVAQAVAEPLRLLTHDKQVARYSASIILV
jgi:PIN domain nuclease of toxin-antitoxin system